MMELFKGAKLLLLENDFSCISMKKLLSTWEMRVDIAPDPFSSVGLLHGSTYDVLLINIDPFGNDCVNLLSVLLSICGTTKLIAMSCSEEKTSQVQLLKMGAFDVVEKPVQPAILYHKLYRALLFNRHDEAQRQFREKLNRTREELIEQQRAIDRLNEQLLRSKRVLSALAYRIKQERLQIEEKALNELMQLVMPVLRKIDQSCELWYHGSPLCADFIKLIEDLKSNFNFNTKINSRLSFTELRVATLVRSGLSNHEIADQLLMPYNTVRAHCRNIRKKLGINHKKYSLRNSLFKETENREENQYMPSDG